VRLPTLLVLFLFCASTGCTNDPSVPEQEDIAHYIKAARDADRWHPGAEGQLVQAFPHLSITQPVVQVVQYDPAFWLVVGRHGEIQRFANHDSVTTLDSWADFASAGIELRGIAFSQNHLFVSLLVGRPTARHWRVASFAFADDGLLDVNQSQVLLNKLINPIEPSADRFLCSGAKGDLYASAGNQMFRFPKEAKPQLFASGFAGLGIFSYDPVTKALWAVDQATDDAEVNLIAEGYDYGWPTRHGRRCVKAGPCPRKGFVDPTVVHEKTQLVGGFVYRGHLLPGLVGAYVYAQREGQIWALATAGRQTSRIIARCACHIAMLAQGADGELLLLTEEGRFYRMVPS